MTYKIDDLDPTQNFDEDTNQEELEDVRRSHSHDHDNMFCPMMHCCPMMYGYQMMPYETMPNQMTPGYMGINGPSTYRDDDTDDFRQPSYHQEHHQEHHHPYYPPYYPPYYNHYPYYQHYPYHPYYNPRPWWMHY